MRITFTGRYMGQEVAGTIEDGSIDADLPVMSLVEAFVAKGVRVGIGPWSGPASLADARSAQATVFAVLDEWPKFEGDVMQPAAAVPEGATP